MGRGTLRLSRTLVATWGGGHCGYHEPWLQRGEGDIAFITNPGCNVGTGTLGTLHCGYHETWLQRGDGDIAVITKRTLVATWGGGHCGYHKRWLQRGEGDIAVETWLQRGEGDIAVIMKPGCNVGTGTRLSRNLVATSLRYHKRWLQRGEGDIAIITKPGCNVGRGTLRLSRNLVATWGGGHCGYHEPWLQRGEGDIAVITNPGCNVGRGTRTLVGIVVIILVACVIETWLTYIAVITKPVATGEGDIAVITKPGCKRGIYHKRWLQRGEGDIAVTTVVATWGRGHCGYHKRWLQRVITKPCNVGTGTLRLSQTLVTTPGRTRPWFNVGRGTFLLRGEGDIAVTKPFRDISST